MSLFPAPGISEKIVVFLKNGPHSVADLCVELKKSGVSVSIQGVYKALRKMKTQGIVILHKKQVVLDRTWLQKIERFTLISEQSYKTPRQDSGHFLHMSDGDKITYSFKDPLQADVFNNHILYILFDAFPKLDSWFAYSTHHWFMIARKEEELALMKHMNSKGIKYIFTAGNSTELDKSVRKYFDGTYSKYHTRDEPLFKDKNYYLGLVINVFGDYIIEVKHDVTTAKKIDAFYKNNKVINAEKVQELKDIVSKQSKNTLSISKNSKKAEQLRKMFSKNFLFK